MALLFFSFTSIMYNYYLGENSLGFMAGENRVLFHGFRTLTMVLVLWGSMQDLGTVFAFADVAMGLLALVNLVALILLFKVGLRLMRDFDAQRLAGNPQPVFDTEKFADLDLNHQAWRDVAVREAGRQPRPDEAGHVRDAS